MNKEKKQLKMSFGERCILAWEILLHGLISGGKEITTVDKIKEASRIRLANYDSRLRNVVVVLRQAITTAASIEESCGQEAGALETQINELQVQIVALNEAKEQVDKRFTKADGVKQKIRSLVQELESNTDSAGTPKA